MITNNKSNKIFMNRSMERVQSAATFKRSRTVLGLSSVVVLSSLSLSGSSSSSCPLDRGEVLKASQQVEKTVIILQIA